MRALTAGLAAVLAGALAATMGCAGASGEPVTPGSSRTREGLDALAHWLHDELTSGDQARLSAVLATAYDVDVVFDSTTRTVLAEQLRGERRHLGRTIRAWGRFAGSRYEGFCARGAGTLLLGDRGVLGPTEAVDELLVVGRFAGREWAGWTREIVKTERGFRILRLPGDSPRSGHPDLDLWACEVARRPGVSRGAPGRGDTPNVWGLTELAPHRVVVLEELPMVGATR